jgi:hypothetical protein
MPAAGTAQLPRSCLRRPGARATKVPQCLADAMSTACNMECACARRLTRLIPRSCWVADCGNLARVRPGFLQNGNENTNKCAVQSLARRTTVRLPVSSQRLLDTSVIRISAKRVDDVRAESKWQIPGGCLAAGPITWCECNQDLCYVMQWNANAYAMQPQQGNYRAATGS